MLIDTQTRLTAELVQTGSIGHLATMLNILPAEIDRHAPFARHGRDSLAVIALTGELAEWLDQERTVTRAWDYPNIKLLSQYLVKTAA